AQDRLIMKFTEIESKLKRYGKSMTPARSEIITMLLSEKEHATADGLYRKLKSTGSTVGRMTVFRTLDLLAEVGVVRPIYQGSGGAHFLFLDDGKHHHLVCNHCDKTVAFTNCVLTHELSEKLGEEHNFRIEGHLLELYGTCKDCQ
ncbi:MAG: transcriptional repressor, partial [Chloroflexota bacterium]